MLRTASSRQRGMSLVELMVGIAVGMFIVAAAAMLVSTQISETRKLNLELQVQQDLRATADIIARDLRRVSATGIKATGFQFYVWTEANGSAINNLSYSSFETALPWVDSNEIQFFEQRTSGSAGPYGYKLEDHTMRLKAVDTDAWQDLTDPAVIKVTDFKVKTVEEPPIVIPCGKLCADGSQGCWPTVRTRWFEVSITAQSKADPTIVRTVTSMSKSRNDAFLAQSDTTNVCPV